MARSVFHASALASGLLTQADLDGAIAQIRSDPARGGKRVGDDEIATQLVEMGRINHWQAGQLREGRTSFTLGPYQIIDWIGQGGMGQVYRAEHSIMGRVVAIKVLPRHKSTPQAIESFTREIRTQAKLDHENLVRAYDAGHDKSVYFLVTEYVPGTDLRRLVRRHGKLSMQSAAAIMVQAARGLHYAHGMGLVHRDVKPGNLLVTPERHTKVSDLGLAGFFGDPEQSEGQIVKLVGTADYLAPELIAGPDRVSPASDVYSLGCTLYYAVTGKVPFPGGTVRQKAMAHCERAPLDPRRLNPDLSSQFVEVMGDMMAKEPAERLQSAGDVMTRLSQWLDGASAKTETDALRALSAFSAANEPPSVAHIPGRLSDTEPNLPLGLPEEPSHSESTSQVSLGTQPVGAAAEETMPLLLADPGLRLRSTRKSSLSPGVRALVGLGILFAAGTLAAVAVSAIMSAAGW